MKEIQEVGRNRIEYKTGYGQSGKLVKGTGCFVNRLDGLGRKKKRKKRSWPNKRGYERS